jgi:hypothetical protein
VPVAEAADVPVRRAEAVRPTQATTPAEISQEDIPVRRAEAVVPLQPFDASAPAAAIE